MSVVILTQPTVSLPRTESLSSQKPEAFDQWGRGGGEVVNGECLAWSPGVRISANSSQVISTGFQLHSTISTTSWKTQSIPLKVIKESNFTLNILLGLASTEAQQVGELERGQVIQTMRVSALGLSPQTRSYMFPFSPQGGLQVWLSLALHSSRSGQRSVFPATIVILQICPCQTFVGMGSAKYSGSDVFGLADVFEIPQSCYIYHIYSCFLYYVLLHVYTRI